MCGIFGYIGRKNNAAQIVLEGLKKLEYRGYDSWGIAIKKEKSTHSASSGLRLRGRSDSRRLMLSGSTGSPSRAKSRDKVEALKIKNQKIEVEKHVGKIGDAKINLPESNMGLGHTRWATHGGVTDINAHPHLDCSRQIAIIHNGIIENYAEIKRDLLKKGHEFTSETDSEVAVHLIEEGCRKKSFKEAVRWAFNQLKGLNAIIAMKAGSKTFVAARTGSPLVVGFGKGENFLASDAAALLAYTKKVYFLEDGELALVNESKVLIFKVKTGRKVTPKIHRLNWNFSDAEKGEYPHFMLKEIFEQPKILNGIANGLISKIPNLAKLVRGAYGTYLVGCGTASYACLAATYFFSKIAQRHVNYAVGSEFCYTTQFLTPKSLVIALSQSGETIDTITSVKEAKKKGAKIVAITNVLGSTLYREADYKMLLTAGPEKAVASTKAFTAKLALLTLLAYSTAGKLVDGKRFLRKAELATRRLLNKTRLLKIKKLANKIFNQEHIYVIGRGLSYAIALEAALKIKEISYMHAEGFAAGELKHGVIALVEKGSPCLVLAPNDETFGAVLSGAMEMKARGGLIIGVSPFAHEIFDDHIPVDNCGVASAIPNTVVAQLLAYYLALKRGCDPDKPRNLAKSVTVK